MNEKSNNEVRKQIYDIIGSKLPEKKEDKKK